MLKLPLLGPLPMTVSGAMHGGSLGMLLPAGIEKT